MRDLDGESPGEYTTEGICKLYRAIVRLAWHDLKHPCVEHRATARAFLEGFGLPVGN